MVQKICLFLCITGALFAQDIPKSENTQTQEALQKWRASEFGLKPHRPNYLLPYGYATKEYDSYVPADNYKQIEAQLQVSLKIEPFRNLLNLDEVYAIAYSHLSFWQAYTDSSPFRETNYNPEVFVTFPLSFRKVIPSLHSLTFGIGHLSNGQGNIEEADIFEEIEALNIEGDPLYLRNRSRSVNYVYATASFETDDLITDITLWLPNGLNNDLEDNPDLMDYLGYGNINLKYFYNQHLFNLMVRLNVATKKGAFEASYSHPISENVYFYAKLFSGYGESLIDYNNSLTKFSVGFSFSR